MWSIKIKRHYKIRTQAFSLILLLIPLITGAVGCAQNPHQAKKPFTPNQATFKPHSNLIESSYSVADRLVEALRQRDIPWDSQMLSASFVSIDNLEESCTLGRLISEQISSRLAQYGYQIMEMK